MIHRSLCILAPVLLTGCATQVAQLSDDALGYVSPVVEASAIQDDSGPTLEIRPDANDVGLGENLPTPLPEPAPGPDMSSSQETLADAWGIAISLDPELEASRWQSSAAQRGLYAANAEKLPSVSATASYSAFDNPLTINAPLPTIPMIIPPGATASVTVNEEEFLLGGVRVTQPVYTFGRISHAIDSAGAEVGAAVANERRTELDVKLQVAAAYIGVLKAQKLVDVADSSVTSLEGHERDVKNLVDDGVGIRANLLAVQVALANAQQFRLQMQNLLTVAEAAYNRALQRPLDTPVDIEDLSPPSQDYDLEYSIQQSLSQRPEIEFLSAKAQALRSLAGSVHAAKKPQVVLQGGFSFIENKFLEHETFNDVTVMAAWNFWDSGRKHHRTAQLEQAAEGLLRQRSQIESVVALQVKSAWHSLDSARGRVAVNQQALKSADENVRVSRDRYNDGVGTNTEVLDAEKLRTDAYSSYFTSLYDAVLAEMQLMRAIGTL